MKKLELITAIGGLLGLMFRYLHVPVSSLLAVLGISLLGVLYFLFGFALFNGIGFGGILKKESYRDTNALRILIAIGLGISLSILVTGLLFKLQLYPGAGTMQVVGLIGTGSIALIATFFALRQWNNYFRRIFKRVLVWGVLGFAVYLFPNSILVDTYYANDPDYARMKKKVLAHPDDEELQQKLREMDRKRIEKVSRRAEGNDE